MNLDLVKSIKLFCSLVYVSLAFACLYATYFLPALSSISFIDHVVAGAVVVSALLYFYSTVGIQTTGQDLLKFDFKKGTFDKTRKNRSPGNLI